MTSAPGGVWVGAAVSIVWGLMVSASIGELSVLAGASMLGAANLVVGAVGGVAARAAARAVYRA